MSTHRVRHFENERNEELIKNHLDLIEERREQSAVRAVIYQQRMARFYNKRVRTRSFLPGDLVLRKVTLNTRRPEEGSLGAKWEGPYKIIEIVRPGAYILGRLDGKRLKKPWNTEMLRKYFP